MYNFKLKAGTAVIACALSATSFAQQYQPLPQPQQAQPQATAPTSLPPLPPSQQGQTITLPAPQANFNEVLESALVLNPGQIREVRKQANTRMRAAQELPQTPPKQVTSLITASPSPGSTSPVLRLYPGYASSVMVTDSTGAPWPIENYTIGHKDNFEVKRLDGVNGSILSVVPLQYYANSNLVLVLKGLASPITISFIAGQKEVDLRADVRVQAKGPNAQLSVGGLPQSTNTQLLSVLEGVPPAEAKQLKVSVPEAQAWMGKNGRLYLRTSLPVISPSWLGSVRSSDGASAYEMMPSTSLLVMKDGQIKQVGVEGW